MSNDLRHYMQLLEQNCPGPEQQLDEKGLGTIAKAAVGASMAGTAALAGLGVGDQIKTRMGGGDEIGRFLDADDRGSMKSAMRDAGEINAARVADFKKRGIYMNPEDSERDWAKRRGTPMPAKAVSAQSMPGTTAKAHPRPGQTSKIAAPIAVQSATAEDKQAFVKKLVPAIERNNAKLKAIRSQVKKIAQKPKRTVEDETFLGELFKTYRVAKADISELMTKINPIPPSLVLAQSAIESGWGLSGLAQRGNVLFGQKTWDKNSKHVSATEDGTKYAAFDNAEQAVAAYMRNLNSHPAYAKLRQLRDAKIKAGEPLKGDELAAGLSSYSTRAHDYTSQVKNFITKQGFNRFDS